VSSHQPLFGHPAAASLTDEEIRATEMIARMCVEIATDNDKLRFDYSALGAALYDMLCEGINTFTVEQSATIAGVAAQLIVWSDDDAFKAIIAQSNVH
jgi:hypothetical protein